MKQPLQIQFLGMDASPALEADVRERVGKLERFSSDLIACRAIIELLNKHQHQGRLFAVRLDLTLPGHELTVNRVQDEDAWVAVRNAFDSMTRQLEDAVRLARRHRKQDVAMELGSEEV